jgi:hypothetical protein
MRKLRLGYRDYAVYYKVWMRNELIRERQEEGKGSQLSRVLAQRDPSDC